MKKTPIIILLLFTLLFSASAFAGQIIFSESFDSIDSIHANGGTFSPSQSAFEPGLLGNALHVKGEEFVRYSLQGIQELNQGSIDFYFKSFDDSYGLVNLATGGNGENIMAFINYHELWQELETGGFYQNYSRQDLTESGLVWHHAALVWDCGSKNGFFKLYLDGIQGWGKWSAYGKCDNINFFSPFVLEVGTSFWYGWGESVFDDLKLYDYVLTDREIQDRVKLLENDPNFNLIELISPDDSATIEATEYFSFDWSGSAGYYNFELSTQSDFPSNKTISDDWVQDFFEYIGIDDFKNLRDKAKYYGNEYYWKVLKKKTKTSNEVFSSEIRKIYINYHDKIELLSPQDGATIKTIDFDSLKFEWYGPVGRYKVQLSTMPNFPGGKTIFLDKYWWQSFSQTGSIENMIAIWKKTKYTGTQYYWRVAKKGSKTIYSEPRLLNIIYEPKAPSFSYYDQHLEKVDENTFILWDRGTTIKSRFEVSLDQNFAKTTVLQNYSTKNYFDFSKTIIKKLKKLAKNNPNATYYARLRGIGIRNETLYSKTITFTT